MLIDRMIDGEMIHPDFEAINELQIFDLNFDIDCPFAALKKRQESARTVFDELSYN